MPLKVTFGHYLAKNVAGGIIDFNIRATVDQSGKVSFYIHPADKDGETMDCSVYGNAVTCSQNAYPSDAPHIESAG